MKTFVRFTSFALLGLAACSGVDDDPCAAMSDKIAQCFPGVTTVAPTCDPTVAERVDEMSCDDLAHQDGKADGWTCLWMPWIPSCASDNGGSSSTGKKIEVSTEECASPYGCEAVTGVGCALVTLHKGSAEVARGMSSGGGRFTFDGLAAGDYTVKVHHRDNTLAKMMPDPYTVETTSASIEVSCTSAGCKAATYDGSAGDQWARFSLIKGTGDKAVRCADMSGELKVKNASGAPVDKKVVEWDWIYEVEKDGVVLERSRPLDIYTQANGTDGKNVIDARGLLAGEYTVRFTRVNIPSYKQKPNPDYAALLASYRANDVAPIEATLKVTSSQASGKTVTFNATITDPLR